MRKGLSVAVAVAGLLVSGSALAALDLSQPIQFDLAIAVQLAAAIATALAAFAAWQAARHSGAQVKLLTQQELSNRLECHRRSFLEGLDRFAASYPASFYQPIALYLKVFPNNKQPGDKFSYAGDQEFLNEIQDECIQLAQETWSAGSDFDYASWAGRVNDLAIAIKLESFVDDGPTEPIEQKNRKYITVSEVLPNPDWQLTYNGNPTGFSTLSCSRVFQHVHQAIELIVMLSGVESKIRTTKLADGFLEKLLLHITLEFRRSQG